MQSSFLVFRSYLENSNQITDFLCSNSHIDLINDESVKEKYKSYLDVDIIPDMYKTGRPYCKLCVGRVNSVLIECL